MTKKVLLLEDDKVYRDRLARSLRLRGFHVEIASSLSELTITLEDFKPDFAILDLRLDQDESGLQGIEIIKSHTPHCKSIVLTGYGTISTTVRAMKLGAVHYLTKPASIQSILKALSFEELDQNEEQDVPYQTLAQLEWDYIQKVVENHNGNITHAAKALGVHRRSLQRKLSKNPAKLS